MGLDVDLYHFENFEKAKELEDRYSEASKSIWEDVGDGKEYEKMTETEKKEAQEECSSLKKTLGLDENGEVRTKTKIEVNSALYPDHYFKIGYFRSSYNSGGINSVLESLGLLSLYDIFPEANSRGPYYIVPDWKQARVRVAFTLGKFKTLLNSEAVHYDATWIQDTPHTVRVESAKEALRKFHERREEWEKDKAPFDAWEGKDGYFSLKKPLEVVAVMYGTRCAGAFRGVFLIHKVPKDSYEWYYHALEIVQETIQYILKHPKPGRYVLGWSS